MPEVRCFVRNCGYWGADLCRAERIEVAVAGGEAARGDPARIRAGHGNAAVSEDTCCVTFKPR